MDTRRVTQLCPGKNEQLIKKKEKIRRYMGGFWF